MKRKKKSEWKATAGDGVPYTEIHGENCSIIIERRQAYCDRGNFIAKLFARGELFRDIDHQDGWPRYYFDLERAKLECEAWLQKRGQWIA